MAPRLVSWMMNSKKRHKNYTNEKRTLRAELEKKKRENNDKWNDGKINDAEYLDLQEKAKGEYDLGLKKLREKLLTRREKEISGAVLEGT